MTRKKSYNPFKMWGSYVGAVLGMFFLPIPTIIGTRTYMGIKDFFRITKYIIEGMHFGTAIMWIIIILIPIILGFLIGWGIHSLVRVLRK